MKVAMGGQDLVVVVIFVRGMFVAAARAKNWRQNRKFGVVWDEITILRKQNLDNSNYFCITHTKQLVHVYNLASFVQRCQPNLDLLRTHRPLQHVGGDRRRKRFVLRELTSV